MHSIKRVLPTLAALVFGAEKGAAKTLQDSVKGTDLKVSVLADDLAQVTHRMTQQSVTLPQGSVLVVEGTNLSVMSQSDFDANFEITGDLNAPKTTRTKTAAKTPAKAPTDEPTSEPAKSATKTLADVNKPAVETKKDDAETK